MSGESLATINPASKLPEQVQRRGISEAQWRTLCMNLFPGANPNSVLLVWDYCIARKLDPLKKPCHIVPMEVTEKSSSGERKVWRDVVMPGIYEYRTTAQRTGDYLGHSEPQYGVTSKQNGVEAPEWCAMTFYRWNPVAKLRVEYPVKVFFREVVAVKSGGAANARWSKAPIQMLTKCTEAAGLREAFPDEFGGETTFEEMDGQRHTDVDVTVLHSLPKPEGYDTALANLQGAAEISFETFSKAWADFPEACRKYLVADDAGLYETLKAQSQKAKPEAEQ